MSHRISVLATGLFAVSLISGSASAAVSPEKASELGGDRLTPTGAERAGNADGTIPAWDGGITEPPASWPGGNTRYSSPFPDDQPQFTITADNYEQHRAKLTAGQIAMFKAYPDTFRMPIYQSRRTMAKPKWVYDAIKENAVEGRMVADGEGIDGATGGIPFPFPKETSNPAKAMIWNHKVRYRGQDIRRTNGQIVTIGDGYREIALREDFKFLYNQRDVEPEDLNNILFYFLQEIEEPPRLAGAILLIHETMNQVKETRRAWLYNPGQRRIRRAPNVAYDNPGTASDGMRTNDQFDMFNGATDRYNWELKGKREVYIPYNAYDLYNAPDYDAIVGRNHANPDLTRYELHRVWVVEGTVKEGTSHIYARRTFYIDEDSWHIAAADLYDARGQLWRVMEGHTIMAYDQPHPEPVMDASYDLLSNRYILLSLSNEEGPIQYDVSFDDNYFNPRNVQREATR